MSKTTNKQLLEEMTCILFEVAEDDRVTERGPLTRDAIYMHASKYPALAKRFSRRHWIETSPGADLLLET